MIKRTPLTRVLVPAEGGAWNPLLNYPRNLPCLCGSGFKFKVCCNGKLPRAVSKDWAKTIDDNWDKIINQEIKFRHHEKTVNPLTWRQPKPPKGDNDASA